MIIAYLYYDFLNLYGENGNVKILKDVLKNSKVKYLSLDDKLEFSKYDVVYIGSGIEENQKIALKKLLKYKKDIIKYIDSNKIFIATGNSLDMFGKQIKDKFGDIYECLGLFDFEVEEGKRVIKEVNQKMDYVNKNILGFENHSGERENNIYKINNFYGTYTLGPVLIRNPQLLKLIINKKIDSKLEDKAYDQFLEIKYEHHH